MFIICRKMTGSPLQVVAWAPCEEFVISYFKYNIGEHDLGSLQVLKAEEVDLAQFVSKAEVPLALSKE
jgi:hypothetical protein